jgi:hypothetical protein
MLFRLLLSFEWNALASWRYFSPVLHFLKKGKSYWVKTKLLRDVIYIFFYIERFYTRLDDSTRLDDMCVPLYDERLYK